MHLILVFSVAATLAIAAGGCSDPESNPPGSSSVGYAKDVQPILKAKCANCHGGTGQGGHNIATNYADAKLPVTSRQFEDCWTDGAAMTMPKTIGECTLLLTKAGKMPAFEACDSPTPPDPTKCLTTAEKDTLAAWVAGGMAP